MVHFSYTFFKAKQKQFHCRIFSLKKLVKNESSFFLKCIVIYSNLFITIINKWMQKWYIETKETKEYFCFSMFKSKLYLYTNSQDNP